MTRVSGLPPKWIDGGFEALIDQASDEELQEFIRWTWRELVHRIDVARAGGDERRVRDLKLQAKRYFKQEIVE